MVATVSPLLTVFYQGQVSPNANVYIYQTGTTTPVTTYSDSGLTIPNTNPIVADSNGQVLFYVATTTALRIDMKTSGGTLIRSVDPVYPAAVASGGGGSAEGTIVASGTTDLGSTGLNLVKITGNTTITSLGSSATTANPLYNVRFTGTPLLTYNGTSLILPGSAPIPAAPNDAALFEYLGSGNWQCLFYQKASGAPVAGSSSALFNCIAGFLPSAMSFTTSASCSMTITAGQATDSTNTVMLSGGSFAWNVINGNAVNGYQGGTTLPSNATIHFFVIATNADTTWSASFASTSLTPTLPGSYTKYRRVHSLPTNGTGTLLANNGSTGIAMEYIGGAMLFYFGAITLDVNVANLGTTATLYTLPVPAGIKVQPLFRATAFTSTNAIMIYSADENDVAPQFAGTAPLFDLAYPGGQQAAQDFVTTNTSAQIRARASGASSTFQLATRGFIDWRRS